MSVVFTFNSVASTTMGLTVIDVQKPVLPPQEESTIDIPKKYGLIQSSKKFISNDIVIKCLLVGTSYSDLITKLQALSAYLYSNDDKELSFDDETDRYWNAQYLKTVIIERTYMYCYLDLVFTCNDPFAYDNTPDSDDQTITVKDDTYIIANGGHYYAYPVITITFNQAQTHIYVQNNSIDGNRFDISKSFNDGDMLEVDCKNGTIKLNGNYSPAGFGDGGHGKAEWLVLAKGDNVITVGTDDESIDISINITFSKVYFY